MNKKLISIVIVIVVLIGILLLINKKPVSTDVSTTPTPTVTSTPVVTTTPVVTATVTVTPKPTITSTPTSINRAPLGITLYSPNGGETMKIGEKRTISFSAQGVFEPGYYVALILEPGYIPLTTITATSSSYEWTVPKTVCVGGDACSSTSPGSYSITARLYEGVPCIGFCAPTNAKLIAEDKSNSNFTITN